MNTYYVQYNLSNGRIIGSGVTQLEVVNSFDNYLQTDSFIDNTKYKVVNKEIVPISESPGDNYYYNFDTSEWVYDTTILSNKVKQQRNELLTLCDWTQIPNNPLTQAKQTEWSNYRQQLRDITSQQGYPVTIVWPTPPN
jgi:hypothetical protein